MRIGNVDPPGGVDWNTPSNVSSSPVTIPAHRARGVHRVDGVPVSALEPVEGNQGHERLGVLHITSLRMRLTGAAGGELAAYFAAGRRSPPDVTGCGKISFKARLRWSQAFSLLAAGVGVVPS
jgi:hypothetical protein